MGVITCLGTIRDQHRLGMTENTVLMMMMIVPKREEVTGYWRKIRNVELHDFDFTRNNYPGNHIMRDEKDGACGWRKEKGQWRFILV